MQAEKPLIFGEGFKKTKKLTLYKSYNAGKDIFTVKYDQDDIYLAAGLGNGDIQLYNLEQNKLHNTLQSTSVDDETPTTCLRWRPPVNKSKHILVSGNSDGSIIHWHAPSGKRLHKMIEEDNSVLCLDFNFDGSLFATGGKDFKKIRVYDDDIKTLQHEFLPADWSQKGHSNRVFAIKFIPDQPNILISGGWDSNLLIWDVREKSCVGQFYGPSLSGDALDFQCSKGIILTGSYRTESQIQLWDFRTRKLMRVVNWMGEVSETNKQVYVYSAQFSKINEDLILAGCSGLHEVKLFDMKRDCAPCGSIINMDKGIYSVDFANTENNFAFGGGEGISRVIQIDN